VYTAKGVSIDGTRCVVRSSDERVLGTVGMSYMPIQNAEAFDWFDPFVTASEATIETAGSLREGSRIWILAKLAKSASVILPGDEVEKYILLANSHDGTLAAQVGFTPVRVVCANTLRMATRDRASTLLRIRHQKNAVQTLADVRDIMNTVNATFEATAEQYRKLAQTSIVEADLKRYVREVFSPQRVASKPGASDAAMVEMVEDAIAEAEADKKSRVYDSIVRLMDEGRGHDIKGVRGSLWGAYNAVTEYIGYERGTDQDVRVNHMWFGAGAKINQRALDAALAMAA
jgi:phage/plasmid-like protein (TIGR03299 family)